MSLSLTDVQRIAAEVAQREEPALQVMAATRGGSDSSYTEVILTVHGCRAEPCQFMVGVSRDVSEDQCRSAVEQSLRRHLTEHPTG